MKTPDVELTEFTDLDPDTLHLVGRGANGFPALLAKSIADEIDGATSPTFRPSSLPRYVRKQIEAQRRHRSLRKGEREGAHEVAGDSMKTTCAGGARCVMNAAPVPSYKVMRKHLEDLHGIDMRTHEERAAAKTAQGDHVKKQKKAKIRQVTTWPAPKRAEAQLKKELLVKSGENAVMCRIGELERQLAKSGGAQKAPGLAFLLNRELDRAGRFMKGVPHLDDLAAVGDYMDRPARTEAQRSTAATARAVTGVQGKAINHMGPFFGAREQLWAILDDTGRPETLHTFEVQTARLEKQLAKATSPAERESLGYQVTRRKLLAMHVRGEG